MTDSSTPRIVVGVDGSDSSTRAAVWAAHQAAWYSAKLCLVHAYVVPQRGYPRFLVPVKALRRGLREQADSALRTATEAVREAAGVRTETRTVEANPVVALLRESHGALMTVVGSRGLGGFAGMLAGSVTLGLSEHSRVPVVVVRQGRAHQAGGESPVVVGVDASPNSANAVSFAFRAAAACSAPLTAVHVHEESSAADPEQGRRLLSEQMAGEQREHPDVVVEKVVMRARVVRTLLDLARDARLLVVGNRGSGGFREMLLGSTTRSLVLHADCSVAVVPVEGGTTSRRQDGSGRER
ncbi:universal stress protein [Actinopolyspora mortivallis]|uniref:Universal stress protein n=1 Tax=Actinopolyspora mortivallis TaxID=33906 RepID=A0A2T0GY02_ACTMO|nr:universal stress protein [Actinopolyspora mortivallis]PRW63999.1 universal stress protein [Actinopolyspora mortivallis]